ncbi:MFS transporter family protein [Methanocaldococcus villosus KIN24-T80]|uniref:MFS transporter family protein n=1 Tax=Methanocaldococcus villosus KIN24-T80 TaxID=1069083 RepID=N6VSD4_9EURY|nr:MFS transporter [Methanocaldococcus villosus]ENN96785.1 MFS transporter family protein [Methanocaldococcus villosus KIN24-T80]
MKKKKIFGIPKNVFLLGIVSFLNDMSSEMITSITPSYLIEVLNVDKLLSGTIMGAIESLSSLFKVIFGYISDKIRNRKVFVSFGYFLSTISKGALAFTHSWLDFLFLRVLDRLGKGIRTAPRDALIAESTKKTGKSFGFHRMMDTLGAVVGPILSIIILELLSNYSANFSYRMIFLLSFIPGILSVLLIIFFIKDTDKNLKKIIMGKSSLNSESLKLFLFVVAVASLGRYSYAFTIWKVYDVGYTVIQGLYFYIIFNIFYAITSYPIGTFSDKFDKRMFITLGFGIAALASLIFAFADSLWMLLLGFIFYSVYLAIEETIPRAYLAEIAEGFEKGTVIGAYHTVFGVFVFPASVIAGWLWQSYSLEYSFLYATVMNSLAMFLMILEWVLKWKS